MSPVASNLPPSTDLNGLAERFMEHWIRIFAFTTEIQRQSSFVFLYPLRLTPYGYVRYALCAVRVSDRPYRFRERKRAYRPGVEVGRGGETQIELGVAGGIGVGRFCLRISVKKIRREAHMVNILGVSAGALLQSLSFFVGTLFSLQK